jgi:hypothetical protein
VPAPYWSRLEQPASDPIKIVIRPRSSVPGRPIFRQFVRKLLGGIFTAPPHKGTHSASARSRRLLDRRPAQLLGGFNRDIVSGHDVFDLTIRSGDGLRHVLRQFCPSLRQNQNIVVREKSSLDGLAPLRTCGFGAAVLDEIGRYPRAT